MNARLFRQWLVVGMALLTVTAVANEKEPVKIIAIGDSITEAYRVIPQAYRYHLAKLMDEKGITYDFIGSRKGVLQNAGDGSVDMDHEGYSGWRSEQVIPKALATARNDTPDVALIHLGTNDLALNQGVDNALSDVQSLIRQLKETNPSIVVFLEMIPWNNGQPVEDLNARLKEYAAGEENVHHVEVRPFEINKYYRDFPKYSLHPNEAGAQRMAEKFFEAMDEHVFSAKPAVTDVPERSDREIRTWTSAKGRQTKARLIKTMDSGSEAMLQTGKTKFVKIAVDGLSEPDQDYVKSLME